MTPMIWCSHHNLRKFTVHPLMEMSATGIVDSAVAKAVYGGVGTGRSALNMYCQTYKQADMGLLGTVREAIQIAAAVRLVGAAGVRALGAGRKFAAGVPGPLRVTARITDVTNLEADSVDGVANDKERVEEVVVKEQKV